MNLNGTSVRLAQLAEQALTKGMTRDWRITRVELRQTEGGHYDTIPFDWEMESVYDKKLTGTVYLCEGGLYIIHTETTLFANIGILEPDPVQRAQERERRKSWLYDKSAARSSH
ncbi:hypothetical protein A2419_02530 [Candidatus Adlerbacteria bacterium RIFOXYC1_FULL_48_26]|uniref:Uncharacterized protein n=1 Tax=Candidatus Adlerbacteria bacterium RIFOXYC1_FULL_48_26 TaxID=1797247 RepID=A0A1F4Y4P8_9BACT|nr:MAG: hypothetical protein A2419_02530 [Candidatus Adlerbacteria bacterium RIFOXYC1_FULL_48_26]OGC93733.1 MAG: hypothetical protein A2389_00980 [Candidatus Adlerbacteria bacterium RIFOXYB1_FULL_48_10]OGC96687.1 MAG: hypothetical protein A2590_02825 [Candidatus Adlerbacteria bacterium RIFOXYD1_FULL_48_8]